jgi:hypothetical protein
MLIARRSRRQSFGATVWSKNMRNDVLTTARIIGDFPLASEQSIVERLVAQGYKALQAELLVTFVPLGLGRAVIARLPVDAPIRVPETALISDSNSNRLVVTLADVPEFATARVLGEETFQTGIIPRERFKAATAFSLELNLITKVLNAGASVSGEIASPILLRLAESPGFEEWYQALNSKR